MINNIKNFNKTLYDFFGVNTPLLAEKIESFISLLLKWNKTINLTAHQSFEEIFEKDILDALSLYKALTPIFTKNNAQNIPNELIDMGAGAGFNGIVIGLMNKVEKVEKTVNPNSISPLRIGFLDSDRKKMNFIRQACRELELEGEFYQDRAEEAFKTLPSPFNITVSRATWSPDEYVHHAQNYVKNQKMNVHKNVQIVFMASDHQNPPSPPILQSLGLAHSDTFLYTLPPQSIKRKVFFFTPLL